MSEFLKVCKDFNKKHSAELVAQGKVFYSGARIPFSSPRMNYMTYGGIPLGKMVEFSGDENSGKTTTALDIVANAQKTMKDKVFLYVDCENTLDVEWAKKLGVDIDTLHVLQPDAQDAEEIFQFILDAIATGEVGLCVLDSLGVMLSAQEYKKEMGETTYGGISKALTSFSKRMTLLCHSTQTVFIGINQMRENLASQYGGKITTGGRAWKHACLIRIEFRKGDLLDKDGKKIPKNSETASGHIIDASIIKTKAFTPDRLKGFYTLNYYDGIDVMTDLIDVATLLGFIQQAGAWYTLIEPETGEVISDADGKPIKLQGRVGVKKYLQENPELFAFLMEKASQNDI